MANTDTGQTVLNLFEYQNKESFPPDSAELEAFLDGIWQRREKPLSFFASDEPRQENQQFIQFLHSTGEIKSANYAGVIQFGNTRINLLPKIFYNAQASCGQAEMCKIQSHILWWLSYSSRFRFPNYNSAADSLRSDFLELLIYIFAKTTRNLLGNSIYQNYHEQTKELGFIKGRLNIGNYIRSNLSTGRWHKLNCDFELFDIDNDFNRIIKYVARLLLNVSSNQQSKRYLREIIFMFDEVSDVNVTARECAVVRLNPMFADFEVVRDYCYLFLSNSVSFTYKDTFKVFAFLLPMERVFEDFISGFIRKELPEFGVTAQSRSQYLDTEKRFLLKPDLLIETGKRTLLADTKYKLVYDAGNAKPSSIGQSDLYQMIAYSIRFGINRGLLLYPEIMGMKGMPPEEICINDELAGQMIKISAYQLPVINQALMQQDGQNIADIDQTFAITRTELQQKLRTIFLESE